MSRNYEKEYANFHKKPSEIARRSDRNISRRRAVAGGIITKNDSRDVHHVDHNTANKSVKNLKAVPKSINRSRKI